MAHWIAYSVVIGLLMAGSARVLEEVFRGTRVPTRLVWFCALILTVGLSAIAPIRAIRREALVIQQFARPQEFAVDPRPGLSGLPAVENLVGESSVPSASSEALPESVSTASAGNAWEEEVEFGRLKPSFLEERLALLNRWLTIGWPILTIVLVSLIVLTLLRSRRVRRRFRTEMVDGTAALISEEHGPAVVGVFHPQIVLPKWLLQRSDEEIHLAVLHELEHVRSRDPLLLAGTWILAALIPWNPAAWWMLARTRLAVEMDCDSRVLGAGTPRLAYGTFLLDLAERFETDGLAGMVALLGVRSHLERRLLAIAMPRGEAASIREWALVAVAAGLALTASTAEPPAVGSLFAQPLLDQAAVTGIATLNDPASTAGYRFRRGQAFTPTQDAIADSSVAELIPSYPGETMPNSCTVLRPDRFAAAVVLLVAGGCALEREAIRGTETGEQSVEAIQELAAIGISHPDAVARLRLSEPIVRIGGRDDRREYFIQYTSGAVRLTDGRIVISDDGSGEIRYFDAQGVHQRTVGGPGSGPGEFNRLRTMVRLKGDTIYGWDLIQRRFTLFTPRGDVSVTAQIPALEGIQANLRPRFTNQIVVGATVYPLQGNHMLLQPFLEPSPRVLRGPQVIQDTVPLFIVDRTGERRIELGPFPETEWFLSQGNIATLPFGGSLRVVPSEDAIYIGYTKDTEIQIVSSLTGKVTGSLALPWEPRPVSAEDIEAVRARRIGNMSQPVRASIAAHMADVPWPEVRPVFSALRVASDGRVWVQRYRALRDATQEWAIFEPSGKLVGRLTMPGAAVLWDAGSDYVITQVADELDVQEIRVHRLEALQ